MKYPWEMILATTLALTVASCDDGPSRWPTDSG